MTRLSIGLRSLLIAALVALDPAVRAQSKKDGEEPRAPKLAIDVVHARVVDGSGRPVAGQKVHVIGDSETPRLFTTDDAGRIVIPAEGVEKPQSLLLVASGPNTIGWASMGMSRTSNGEGSEKDPLIITLFPRNGAVTGTLIDRAGKPISGARVEALQLHNEVNGSASGFGVTFEGWPLAAVSDGQGRFTIALPENAGGLLLVRHKRYYAPPIGFNSEHHELAPTTLKPGGSIAGVVIDSATGRPVSGATITAQSIEHGMRVEGGDWSDSVTDERGRFELNGLRQGVVNVLFTRSARARASMTAAALEGVRVKVDEETLVEMKAIEGRRVRGKVVDPDNKPVADVMIGCYSAANPRSGAACKSTTSTKDGTFELFVPPGKTYVYIMDFNGQGRLGDEDLIVEDDRDPKPIRLVTASRSAPRSQAEYAKAAVRPTIKSKVNEVSKKKVQPEAKPKAVAAKAAVPQEPEPAEPGGFLLGRVTDLKGKPIAGVRVYINQPGLFRGSASDREGNFVLQGIPEGELKINLSRPDYLSAYETVAANREEREYVLTPKLDVNRQGAAVPADVPAGLEFIDLEPYGNDRLRRAPGGNGHDLSAVPLGVQKLGDDWFKVGQMMIHLKSRNIADLPAKVEGIKVGVPCVRLRFLHATQFGVAKGQPIGAYRVHYNDRTVETIPIVFGEDIDNWMTFRVKPPELSRAKLAWTGENESTALNPGARVHLFSAAWTNPHPKKVIAAIDFESTETLCDPFLVGLTAEKE